MLCLLQGVKVKLIVKMVVGEEFQTDPDNLEAWHEVWQQPHHW